MDKTKDIWQEAFNNRNNKYHIDRFLLEDLASCTYLLEDGNELRLTVNSNMYHFSKNLRRKNFKHIARIFDCFKIELPDQRGEETMVFGVITEPIKRYFEPREVIQSGINLLTNTWSDYLRSVRRLDLNPYISIDKAYSERDNIGRNVVVKHIKKANTTQAVKDIAIALNNTYMRIKELDPLSHLFLYTDNIGLAENGIIKICNIGHVFMGLDGNYEIDLTPNAVSISYDPYCDDVFDDYFIRDNRMLIPLRVYIDGHETPVLGQIDTGATSSGFSESFYERASLENFGETKIVGSTGVADSIKTRCIVKFPNGYMDSLHGSTLKDIDEVSIVIGMDLLSRCKFESEPYKKGFRYKLTFL